MKSLTIRKTELFNIDDTLPLLKNSENIGNIAPTGKTFAMEGVIFESYQCSYYINYNDTIIVEINGNVDTVESYKKSSSFMLYYVRQSNMLFIDAPTGIAKNFMNALEKQFPNKVKTSVYNFDFKSIGQHQSNTKAIYFSVDDDVIDSKTFHGNGVHEDMEAIDAIDNSNATYLMVEIDLRLKSRTIGFSKKGAIVIYSKPLDLSEFTNPELQLAYDAINKFN